MDNRPLLFREISIRTILPNVVTLLAFVAGLTAIRFALAGKWELAVWAVIVAGVFDGLDGTVARLLKSTSRFGAELDSLSDNVAFGVAPAVVLYLWTLESIDRLGWAFALLYAIAMALRLARFNARMEDEDEPRRRLGFITGVPAPMGAALMLMPIMIDLVAETDLVRGYPRIIGLYVMFVAMLMVSTLPTWSLKSIRMPKQWFSPFMLLIGAIIAGLFARTWEVIILLGLTYLATLPFSYVAFKRRVGQKQRQGAELHSPKE
ncbi:CDP-alcohol phosphatidyltransferase family protein [Gimibacter soli]|uniref:Phosphatidylcholine/phosphatidylserine synthase n=1 Tax=Gimibacter soli TaxID=3024400 RepID=A0AAF0BKT9_9PROT|nr:phosphatidylcholine/phosphatidylserine synthase [Gimibacter soli]WCL52725.1 phosphatidylcholine/phosphatidylserine synthase [Gimibacter soli]